MNMNESLLTMSSICQWEFRSLKLLQRSLDQKLQTVRVDEELEDVPSDFFLCTKGETHLISWLGLKQIGENDVNDAIGRMTHEKPPSRPPRLARFL